MVSGFSELELEESPSLFPSKTLCFSLIVQFGSDIGEGVEGLITSATTPAGGFPSEIDEFEGAGTIALTSF
jgi:hypothetical protein